MPPSHISSTGSSSRMRCFRQRATIPTSVEMNVAIRIGRKTSVGLAAPAWARYIIIEMGMKHSPDALSIRNIIIASVAVSFSLLSVCSSCMAFSPKGVAALSRPSMLADTFMKMDPMAGCPFGTPGNRRQNNGDISRPKKPITPARSPIFIRPSHNDRMPVRPREISNAVAAELKDEPIISPHIPTSPQNTDR